MSSTILMRRTAGIIIKRMISKNMDESVFQFVDSDLNCLSAYLKTFLLEYLLSLN